MRCEQWKLSSLLDFYLRRSRFHLLGDFTSLRIVILRNTTFIPAFDTSIYKPGSHANLLRWNWLFHIMFQENIIPKRKKRVVNSLCVYMLRPHICHFFSTNVILGSIFLHMKIAWILHIWRHFLHHTHAISGEFQISPHLSCGDIWNFSTCGEIFNFPTIVIHGKLKFLHMTIFSPQI